MSGVLVGGIIVAMIIAIGIVVNLHLTNDNFEVIGTGSDIAARNNIILKEAAEVILHTDEQLMTVENKGQKPLKILEYRILDDDGDLLHTCYVNHNFRSGSIKTLNNTDPCVLTYTYSDLSCLTNRTACIDKYDVIQN